MPVWKPLEDNFIFVYIKYTNVIISINIQWIAAEVSWITVFQTVWTEFHIIIREVGVVSKQTYGH
jgi:hypothetical protein